MGLIKADGFDAYTTLSQRWNSSSAGVISTTTPRTGRACWQSNNGVLKHVFPTGDAHATFVVGFACWRDTIATGSGYLYLYGDNGVTHHITLTINGLGGGDIRRGTSAGTVLATFPTDTFPQAAWFYGELKVLLSDTVGTVQLRANGNPTPIVNLTAQDTKNAGTNLTFDSIALLSQGGGSPVWRFDDLYICNGAGSVNNDFLGDSEVNTLLPIADGPSVAFTPSTGSDHYALVDEIPPSTSDYNTGATDGDRELYQFTGLTATSGIIRAVATYPHVAKVGTDPKFIQDTVRIGATDYDAASVALGTGFVYVPRIREVSPATAAAWSVAEVNAARFGVVAKDS